VILWASVGGLLPLLSDPCRADIAPESGLLAHVQPVSGSCETPITHCSQIIRSTTAEGPVEFLIFFMRGAYSWEGEAICLVSLDNALSWPEAWQLVEFEPCWGIGSLNPNGATHALHLEWWGYGMDDVREGVIPVARLVMNVVGPGRLDIVGHYGQNPVVLQLLPYGYCSGPTFVTYPVQVYAEAGMRCGYISAHCGYDEERCEAHFEVAELLLSAPSGGVADTSVTFYAYANLFIPCDMAVDTHAPWCAAWVDTSQNVTGQRLHVTADAVGLSPGTYETAIELSSDWGPPVARCLPVEFTVEEPIVSVEEEQPARWVVSWGRVKAFYR
jgi:hypothetical protein